MLEDPDEEAGDDVDDEDEDGGEGVALREAGGAVHSTAELGLARFTLDAMPGKQMAIDADLNAERSSFHSLWNPK